LYPISSDLRQCFERGEKKSVLITLKNYQYEVPLEITEADIISNSLSIDRYCITGNKIEIGSAISAELSLAINNNSGKFDDVTFEGSELFVKIGIAGVADSYVPCGKFTVDEPPRNKRRINIKALDFMMLLDNKASVGSLSFETPEKLVKSICANCYVRLSSNVDFSNFANTSKKLVAPTTEVTYRQLLQWVCQILGVCAYFDGNGELMLSWYTDAKDASGNEIKIDTSVRYSGDAYENDIEITGVVIKTSDEDIKSGTTSNALIIENNQLLDSADTKLSDVAGNIWNKVKGFKYRPYECSCMPMPYLFPLDKIVYKDQNDNEITTIVTHHNFGLNGTSALAAKGETEQQRGYAKSKGVTKDEINAAIAEAMKGVDLKTDHFHVKYSAYPDGKDPDTGEASWSVEPEADSVYIGTCVIDSASAPESPESYNWIKIKGEDGKGSDGVGITAIEEFYCAHTSTSADGLPDKSSWSNTIPSDYGVDKPYLWNYTKTTFTEGDPNSTDPQVIAYWSKDGAPGQNGRGVEWIKEYYLLTDTESVPDKSSFDTNDTTVKYPTIDNPFLWNYESIKYTDDDTPQDSDVKLIGVYGQNGNDGISIDKVTNYYFTTDRTNITNESDVAWSETITPVSEEAPYLWNYEEVTYTGGKQPTKTPACIIGNYAKNGENGVGITDVIEYYATSTEPGKAPAPGDYSTTMPELNATNKYLWNKELITYTNNPTGEFTTPCVIGVFGEDGKTYYTWIKYADDAEGKTNFSDSPTGRKYMGIAVNKSAPEDQSENSNDPTQYKWSLIKGADGKNGENGGTLQVKYKSSSTKPTISNNNVSNWSDEVPTPSAGQRVYMTQKLSTETNWSTPIQISGADGVTPTVSISTDGYWIINGEKTSTKAQGEKPTITVGSNGNWLVDGKDTGTKAQGAQGKDGADIEYVYYRSQNAVSNLAKPKYENGTLSSGWKDSPQGITETYKYEYVSVRTKAAGSSTWGEYSTPVIWSKWGEKGTDGDGVEYKYYLSSSDSKPTYSASSTSWKDEPTGVSEDYMYEYVVQITHHGDGTSTTSDVALWAKWGEQGTNGRTVVSITTQYHISTSNTEAPAQDSSSWSTDIPEWVANTYLWQREVTVFDNPEETKYGTPILDKSWDALGTAVSGYSVLTEATENLNAVFEATLGLNKAEKADGTYYYSATSLESSKNGDTIFKLSSAGFGVCKTGWNNGDPQFSYGFTDTGDAVWKTLTAHKISADLIEAGEVKSVSNAALETSFDLNSGLLTMKSVDGKESFGFGVNNNNHLMLQYNYSDTSKLGVVIGFYYNGNFYKDFEYTQAYTPSTNYYYIDALTYVVRKWSGTQFIVLSSTNSEFQTVLDSQKGFALHAKSKTAGYTIEANGTVTSDFNTALANIYGFDTTADSLVNVTKKTPVFKFYDATQESSGEVSHLTAIRKNSIVTTYMGAENYAIPVSGTLFDLGKLIEGIVEQIQGVVLYDATGTENNATNRNADVELNQSVTDFSYIEIYFEDSNGDNGGCTKVYRPYAKDIMLSINEPASNVIYIRSTIVTVYTEKITIDTSKSNCISMTSDGGIKKLAGNQIFITRVVGYKDHNIIAQPHTCNSFVSKVTSKVLPTCTEAGYEITTYSCSICGKVQGTETSALNAIGHRDDNNDGKCDNCGSSDISHTHRYTSVVTPPTATAQGYTTYTCNCGYSYTGNYTNPTGCSHSSTAVRYETTKNATCTTAGSRNKITYCKSCNAVISSEPETIPTTAHNYVNGTCSVCGATSGGTSGEQTITEGVTKAVVCSTKNSVVYLKFIPQYTGTYKFESLDQSSLDPDGYVYDSNKSQLHSGTNTGGFSFEYNFTAGTTYYLGVKLYSGTGTVSVKVSYNGSSGGGTTGTTTIKVTTSGASGNDYAFIDSEGTTVINPTAGTSYAVYAGSTERTISKVELYVDGSLTSDVSSGHVNADRTVFAYSTTVSNTDIGKTLEYKVYFTGSSSGGGGTGGTPKTIIIGANGSKGSVAVYRNGEYVTGEANDTYSKKYTFNIGDTVKLVATPSAGAVFSEWLEYDTYTAVSNATTYTFTVSSECHSQIRATFR
jgi:hypothetical protein